MRIQRVARPNLMAAVMIVALLVGCRESGTEPKPEGDLAYISMSLSSVPLVSVDAPPHAGQPFVLTVNSFGSDGCWSRSRTDLDTTRSPVVITPYNRYSGGPNVGCAAVITRIPHTVTLTFATAGHKSIIVRGRDFDGGSGVVQLTASIEVLQ